MFKKQINYASHYSEWYLLQAAKANRYKNKWLLQKYSRASRRETEQNRAIK